LTLGYFSVPGEIAYLQHDWRTGADEQQADGVGFGGIGLRVGLPLPQRIGPFGTGVEVGFGVPVAEQTLDHRRAARNGADANERGDEDFTTWSVTNVPLLLTLRYDVPSAVVAVGGQLGVGPVLLGVREAVTLADYDASGVQVRKTVSRRPFAAVAFAAELAAGMVIPVTGDLSLKAMAGLVWVSPVEETVTRTVPSPALTSGGAAGGSPAGLTLGGLGFSIRLGIAVGL
jgi:hypothetical protein